MLLASLAAQLPRWRCAAAAEADALLQQAARCLATLARPQLQQPQHSRISRAKQQHRQHRPPQRRFADADPGAAEPALPSSIGTLQRHHPAGPGSALLAAQPVAVADGQLSQWIAAAASLADVEELVLRYHTQFRHYHLAAAVVKLPHLQLGSALNMQQRCSRLTRLLASGLLNVSQRLDAHQVAGCLAALSSPRCVVPLQPAPLQRLLLLLVQADGAALQQLHSYELADCAAAAAALQEAVLKQQQQQKQQAGASNTTSSSVQPQPPGLLEPPPQQEQQQQQQGAALSPYASLAAAGGDSSRTSSAVALADPLERLWLHLASTMLPQLATFSADSLALTALSFAAAGRASEQLMLGLVHASLARPQKFEQSPLAISRMLQALALTDTAHEGMLGVLAGALSSSAVTKGLSSSQVAAAAAALARLGHYHEPALLSLCKAGVRTLKHWRCEHVVSLLTSLERLRYRDQPLLAAAVKVLRHAAAAAADGQQLQQQALTVQQMADSLAAVLQLAFSGTQLEELLMVACRHTRAVLLAGGRVAPAAAIKLLWSLSVLEAADTQLTRLLLRELAHVTSPRQLSQQDLRLLHQARRLSAQQQAGDAEGDDTEAWPPRLLAAAHAAARAHAQASASRSRAQQAAVQGAFEDLGLAAPAQGLALDGGALQPDLAFVTGGAGHSRPGAQQQQQQALPALKVALMCDHAARHTRNAPHELLGYWRVAGWLLEADGWRVVRLPAHAWALLVAGSGRAGDASTSAAAAAAAACAHVFNTLAAAGIRLA